MKTKLLYNLFMGLMISSMGLSLLFLWRYKELKKLTINKDLQITDLSNQLESESIKRNILEKTLSEKVNPGYGHTCGIRYTFPPITKYDETDQAYYWDINDEWPYEANLISKISASKNAIAFFRPTYNGTDAIKKAIFAGCIQNNGKYKNNDEFIQSLKSALKKYNDSLTPNSKSGSGSALDKYTIEEIKYSTKWNQPVVELKVKSLNVISVYTIFVTPSQIYEIRLGGGNETDLSIQNEAQQIFDSLQFTE